MNVRQIAAVAASVAAVAVFAGCTDGGIVTETPTPTLPTLTATTSPSPSVSLGPLTDEELLAMMPPDAAFGDVRGAIATAQFFLEQFSIMFQTGDVRVIEALSAPECVFCGSSLEDAREEIAIGDYETGGDLIYDSTDVRANYYEKDGYTYVDMSFTQSPFVLHHADGSADEASEVLTGRAYFRLGMDGAKWLVVGVEVERDS